jgi:hypothetical protein
MLAAGLDREASRWAPMIGEMDDPTADAAWAMIAVSAPDAAQLDLGSGRISAFIGRDKSRGKHRSALLVGALAALGRVDSDQLNDLNRRHGLRLERLSRWTQLVDASAGLGQGGTVMVLTGTGFQGRDWGSIPPAHLFHSLAALRRTGQDYLARMIAAEALSRT